MSDLTNPDWKVYVPDLPVEIFKKLIPVKCAVKDCNQTQKNYSIPVQLKEMNYRKKALIFVCPKHHKPQNEEQQNEEQQNEETRIQFAFLANQIIKQLKPVKEQDYDLQLYQANNKLDTNACCMRENAKTLNLEKLLTLLQLFSLDNKIIFQLVKKSYIQQYFMYYEVKQKIKKAPNNPLAILHLIHLKGQLKAQLQKNWGDIVDSMIILQPSPSNIYDLEQSSIIFGRPLIQSSILNQE